MITNIKINDITQPLGFKIDDYIKVSWLVDNSSLSGTRQIAGQIKLAMDFSMTDIVFDSGQDDCLVENYYYIDQKFAPRTRYYVQITIWTDQDEEVTSEVTWFETAKQDETWQAQWIGAEAEGPVQLVKDFTVTKDIAKARLYILGLGVYEAYLNGQKLGDEYLAPGFHSYDFWLQYQTYEVNLQAGQNRLQVYLGDGWYKGRIGFDGGYTNLYGDQTQLLAELIVTYADGSEEVIPTDLTWQAALSPVTFSAIYDGEMFDARLLDIAELLPVHLAPNLTDRLNARMSLPVKTHEVFKPEILITPAGETVLDFGQNLSGWVEFQQALPAGITVSYEVGEILQEGNFYRDNLRTAEAKFTYISDGKERLVRPHFTFYGFRYAKLTGFPEPINPDDFIAKALYSDLEESGTIVSSNPKVNQLISNIKWGQKGNFLDVPTDCPQRDERLGWTGDTQIFARTASYLMFTPAFYQKFLEDLRKEQSALDGSVPFMVPMLKPESRDGFVMGNGAAVWSDAATVIPWVLYEQYGDIRRLAENYPVMKDWVDYIYRQDEQTGSTRLWTTNFQFGDWLSLDGKDPNSPMGGTDTVLVASVFYYYSTTLLAKAAQALDLQEDVVFYGQLADAIKVAIQEEFFTKRGRLAITTQTAHVLVLYFELVPEEALPRTIASLKNLLLENAVHLKTGFTGTPYICEALSKHGLTEYAYTLLLNDDYPSWLYAVKLGATTVWERWNSVLEDGSISGTGMNSLNHYAYGSIAEWIYRVAAGIQADPNQVAFKHFYLKPQPSWQLRQVTASYQSVQGLILSQSQILDNGDLEFTFVIPFNTTATVVLPHANLADFGGYGIAEQVDEAVHLTLTSGEYHFTYTPTRSYKPDYSVEDSFEALAVPVATSQIIYKHIPFAKKNDMVLSCLDLPIKDFDQVPIINRMVDQTVIAAIQQDLEKLS